PQPPSTFNRSLSPQIDMVVLRALAKNPHDRFRSVSEFAAAFTYATDVQFAGSSTIAFFQNTASLMPPKQPSSSLTSPFSSAGFLWKAIFIVVAVIFVVFGGIAALLSFRGYSSHMPTPTPNTALATGTAHAATATAIYPS